MKKGKERKMTLAELDRRISSIETMIDANKDKIIQAMSEQIEIMKKLKAAYEDRLDTQKKILMLCAGDKQAMKEKIDRYEEEMNMKSNHDNDIGNQHLV